MCVEQSKKKLLEFSLFDGAAVGESLNLSEDGPCVVEESHVPSSERLSLSVAQVSAGCKVVYFSVA